MEELKACNVHAMWNAVNELEDAAMHPGKKKSLSTETLSIAIAAVHEIAEQTRNKNAANRRTEPENKPLTCKGCESEYSEEMCNFCSRAIRSDYYARKPEGSESP